MTWCTISETLSLQIHRPGLQAFLTNRSQRVTIDDMTSHATNVLSAMSQGTVLAPLLFLMYTNDLITN